MNKSKRTSSNKNKNRILKGYLVIALISFAVYANSLSNEFVFDDESVVLGDPTIIHLYNIPRYFTAQEGFHKVIGRYYRPVVSASYAIDCAVWDLKPFGFHLTNILLHIINSLLVFKFLIYMFEEKKGDSSNSVSYIAAIGALVFAVHPIHTEAVSWVSGRTDSLSFTFFIASFIYYLKFSKCTVSSKKKLFFALVCVYYVLSLLSKEMAITLPVVIVLYDLVVPKLSWNSLKGKMQVYFAMAAISVMYLVLRWVIMKDVPERETYYYFFSKDIKTTFLTMFQTIPLYLKLLVLPVGLIYHYNGYLPYINSFLGTGVIIAFVVTSFLVLLCVYLFKKHSLISFSILFFFVTLMPVMNIIPTMNFMAERFLYIPSISIILILVYLVHDIKFQKYKSIIFSFSLILIIIFGILTIERNADWKNNDSLFLSAEGKPGTVTYVNIGNIYANKQQFDKAEIYYRKAIDLRDETLLANNNLGKIFMIRGDFDSAFYYITKSFKLDTLSPEPRYTLAQLYVQNNMIPQAVNELQKLHQIVPSYMNSLQMLNDLILQHDTTYSEPNKISDNTSKISILESDSFENFKKKNYPGAIRELLELVELNPSSKSSYYNNIGMCYMEQEKLDEAKKYLEYSIESDAKFSTAYNNLGSVYEKLGELENARRNYKLAVDTDPKNQSAKDNLNRIK